ncbi:bifunctional riboflavin kinase/FAD synthetase [Sphingomonas sp. LHG3406-1]|uniref:bifunctional riboflavin kinase/FAD synthetase n=1 Tax=Sphingomonas sp. LHG3406-1 TaxID=2804617 RepID=UPI00262EB3D5|nr:bifunctional riboflavin kinase/FAD synthetase [Sphingomonas sp. LHG3406-1]
MQRLTLGGGIPEAFRNSVVALGNFDGFHLGHQAVVGRAVARAAHEGTPAIVATFDPHPVRFFKPDAAPFRLTSLDQRQELFGGAGADAMLVFGFDAVLAATTAEEFVRLLGQELGARAVVTGEDFTFGARRGGNAALLRELGSRYCLAAEAVGPVALGEEPVSSSRIRQALGQGDTATATRLLTRPFAIRGTVQHGDKRGRELGYPTANMVLSDYQRPAYGIYAVTVRLSDGSERPGVANIGVRPTFDPPVELLETFVFDWSGDLYGQEIEVALHHFIRPERRFEGMDALAEQMRADEAEARRLLFPSPRA